MGDPRVQAFDPQTLLGALNRHGVAYVLVGGLAARALGAQRPTTDVDVCAQWTTENLDRLAAALRELGAGLRVEGSDEPFPVPVDARMIAQLELSTWRSAHGDLDVLRGLPAAKHELVPYEQLMIRAHNATLDGYPVAIAALDDIILSKEVVDRPTDRDALPELRQLRDAIPLEPQSLTDRLGRFGRTAPRRPDSGRPGKDIRPGGRRG